MATVKDVCWEAEVASATEEGVYNNLRDRSMHYPDSQAFKDALSVGEEEFIHEKFDGWFHLVYDEKRKTIKTNAIDIDEATAKSAGFKYTSRPNGRVRVHILPAKYKTARSVVLRGMDAGLDMTGKGKTEVEKELASRKRKTETHFETAMRLGKALKQHYPMLSSGEWHEVYETITGEK